jgi:hypothetical protein
VRPIRSVKRIKDPYSKRILSNVINKNPVNVLAATPVKLRRLLQGLSDKQLRSPLKRGKWSITQIVNHLADAELVLGFRLRVAIAESGSPLQAFDEQKWASRLRYDKADGKRKLALFLVLRDDNLAMLRSLPKKFRTRYGMHEERGKETVERMAQMYAGHDVNHLRQIGLIRRSLTTNHT